MPFRIHKRSPQLITLLLQSTVDEFARLHVGDLKLKWVTRATKAREAKGLKSHRDLLRAGAGDHLGLWWDLFACLHLFPLFLDASKGSKFYRNLGHFLDPWRPTYANRAYWFFCPGKDY